MPDKEISAYEMPDGELLLHLLVAHSRVVGSANYFGHALPGEEMELDYLKSAVRARMAGRLKPPYDAGARVTVTAKEGVRARSLDALVLPLHCRYTVKRAWYVDDSWFLEFEEVQRTTCAVKYPAEAFKAVEEKHAVPAEI